MQTLLEGKVAFVTGAARGQGRSHAVQMAAAGADIIAVDICDQIDSVPYPLADPGDLAQTVAEVEAHGRQIVAVAADVRDEDALRRALEEGIAALGAPDIVVANAGIWPIREHPRGWQDTIDVNLTGVMHTIEAAIPSMIDKGSGGSIVVTSSTAGLNGIGGPTRGGLAYNASKHAIVGLMRFYANYLAPHSIRVNTVHPTGVATPMIENAAMEEFVENFPERAASLQNALPVSRIEAQDVTNAVMYLVSDAGRFVTGIALPVDAGFTNRK